MLQPGREDVGLGSDVVGNHKEGTKRPCDLRSGEDAGVGLQNHSHEPTVTREMDNLGGSNQQGRYVFGLGDHGPSKTELPNQGHL